MTLLLLGQYIKASVWDFSVMTSLLGNKQYVLINSHQVLYVSVNLHFIDKLDEPKNLHVLLSRIFSSIHQGTKLCRINWRFDYNCCIAGFLYMHLFVP